MKAFNGAHFFKAPVWEMGESSISSIDFPEKFCLFFSQVERESDMRSLEEAHNRRAPGDLVGGGG